MISSSQYSPNIPHTSRVSPVMESDEEEFEDSGDDWSPSDNNANMNGEAYLVTDFYHQPVPLPGGGVVGGSRASDSGPEYSMPFANTQSPGSMRHVFTPASSAFQSGTKQKPRMGIMAKRSLSEKPQKSVDLRNYHPEIAPSQISNEDLDSPVYDSTQYIVTPTRRRNSDYEKSPNGRNTIRRETGGTMEYPEVRGRLGNGEELPVVPPGVVLLQPNMFTDGTLDSRIMSEIEMSNLRVAMPSSMRPSSDTDHSGDSSTVQDRLLTGNHMTNGKSVSGQHPYHHHHNQHKNNVYALGAPRPRPMTGSGVVFRRKRKPFWCVVLVIMAIALMAAGVSLGVLFGVVKKGETVDASSPHQRNGSDNSTTQDNPAGESYHENDGRKKGSQDTPGGDRYGDGGDLIKLVTESTKSPVLTQKTLARTSTPPPSRRQPPGGNSWSVSVRRFKAYWHPGDSRIMEVLLSNGTVLQAAGRKGNDGTFQGLYSLSIMDGRRRTTRVRFLDGRNLASVILPDGTVVSLDWSANTADIECKIFQIPPPRGAPGGYADYVSTPTSHLAMLQLGVHSYLLRQLSETLMEASAAPGAWEEETLSTATPKYCAPRLPVKVTKCGGQYPYGGAYVQGEISLRTGPPLSMAALPWNRQDDRDDCYSQFSSTFPNFYIPLPGHVDRNAARDMAGRFWRTAARWWGRVCEVVSMVLEVDVERHKVCADMAASAQTQLRHTRLHSSVYEGCTALLNSLYLTCRTLDDLTTRAAANLANGSSSSNSASSDLRGGSRQPLMKELLQRVLANATSLQEPSTSRQQEVRIKTYAFCPSTQPLTSYEKTIMLNPSSQSQDISAADMVHVNCPGHPEVTYFYLGHAGAVTLDKVKHRLQVCAVCAFEKTFTVHVQRDHMCCNDTCTRELRCEESVSEARAGPGLSESHTFQKQSSVYCHEFLATADTPTLPMPAECQGSCQSNLEVRFQVKDSEDEGSLGVGGGRVYLDQTLSCLEGSKSTCKSTFGH